MYYLSKLLKIRDLIEKSREIKQNSTKLYREFQEQFLKEKRKIELNSDYTAEGKDRLIKSLKKKKSRELLQISKNQRDLYMGNLNKAKELAEEVAFAKLPAVDQKKMERFDKSLSELKTEILLSTNPESAKVKLKKFIKSIDEYSLADKLKANFTELISPVIEQLDSKQKAQFKKDFQNMFDDVRKRSMTDEALETIELMDISNNLSQAKIFNQLVTQKAGENFGNEIASYINRPNDYFDRYPEDLEPISDTRTVEEIIEEENAKK